MQTTIGSISHARTNVQNAGLRVIRARGMIRTLHVEYQLARVAVSSLNGGVVSLLELHEHPISTRHTYLVLSRKVRIEHLPD
jgi:hypothetical protein